MMTLYVRPRKLGEYSSIERHCTAPVVSFASAGQVYLSKGPRCRTFDGLRCGRKPRSQNKAWLLRAFRPGSSFFPNRKTVCFRQAPTTLAQRRAPALSRTGERTLPRKVHASERGSRATKNKPRRQSDGRKNTASRKMIDWWALLLPNERTLPPAFFFRGRKSDGICKLDGVHASRRRCPAWQKIPPCTSGARTLDDLRLALAQSASARQKGPRQVRGFVPGRVGRCQRKTERPSSPLPRFS